MTAAALLSRLDGIKKTGQDRWLARCPAHVDRSPSLSVRELPDGRVLCHCFAGCGVDEILSATELGYDALYPERPMPAKGSHRERQPFNARDVLRAVAFEITTVRLIAIEMRDKGKIGEGSQTRLALAMARLMAADEMANGC